MTSSSSNLATDAPDVPAGADDHITSSNSSEDNLFTDVSLDTLLPLGLSLTISAELIAQIQRTVFGDVSSSIEANTSNDVNINNQDKKKASNFSANSIKIGTWEKIAVNEGEIVVKFYFAKKKLVWEILDRTLKRKIEIQWADVSAIRAHFPEQQHSILQVELNRPPSFLEEKDPQPKRHTLWQPALDFTGGQGSTVRVHQLEFAEGLMNKHYEKLLALDDQMRNASQCPFSTVSHFSVTYQKKLYDLLTKKKQPLEKGQRNSGTGTELTAQTDPNCSSGKKQASKKKTGKTDPRGASLPETNTQKRSLKRTSSTSKTADPSKKKGKKSASKGNGELSKANTVNVNSSSSIELSPTNSSCPSSTAVQIPPLSGITMSPRSRYLSQASTISSSASTFLSQRKAMYVSGTSRHGSQTDTRNPSSAMRYLFETTTPNLSHRFDLPSQTDILPSYLSHTNFRNPTSSTTALLSQTNFQSSRTTFPSLMHTRDPGSMGELLPPTISRNPSSSSALVSQVNVHSYRSAFPSNLHTRPSNLTSELLSQTDFRGQSFTDTLLSQMNVSKSTSPFPSYVHTSNPNPMNELLSQTNFRTPGSTSTLLSQMGVHNSTSGFLSNVHTTNPYPTTSRFPCTNFGNLRSASALLSQIHAHVAGSAFSSLAPTMNPNPTSEFLPGRNTGNPTSASVLLSQMNAHNSSSTFPSHAHTINPNPSSEFLPQEDMDTDQFCFPFSDQENIFTPAENMENLHTLHHAPNDHQNLENFEPFSDILDNISEYCVDNSFNQTSPVPLADLIEGTAHVPDVDLPNLDDLGMIDDNTEQYIEEFCKMFLNDVEEEKTETYNTSRSWDLDDIADHLFNDQSTPSSPDQETLLRKIRSIEHILTDFED